MGHIASQEKLFGLKVKISKLIEILHINLFFKCPQHLTPGMKRKSH